jgi:zinc transport system substrate-binding protein
MCALAAMLTAAGAGGAAAAKRPTLVAAFYPIAYAAEQVGGAGFDVSNLTPAGAEPHDLELRPSDVVRIQHARLVLYFGGGFQPAVEKAVESTHPRALDLLSGQQLATDEGEGGKAALDPHIWLDPIRYGQLAARIGRALGRTPAARRFEARLRALDGEYRRGLAGCRSRTIVTSHAAFGYLARRYGLRQLALEGLSPEAEPSPRALADLVDAVRKSGATTVFFETLVSPKLAETVAREAHVKTAVLDPIEGLSSDAVSHGANYFTVMRSNLRALQAALGC